MESGALLTSSRALAQRLMRIGMTALLEPSSGVGPGRGPNVTSSVALGPPRVYLTSASDQAPDAVLLRVIVETPTGRPHAWPATLNLGTETGTARRMSSGSGLRPR